MTSRPARNGGVARGEEQRELGDLFRLRRALHRDALNSDYVAGSQYVMEGGLMRNVARVPERRSRNRYGRRATSVE